MTFAAACIALALLLLGVALGRRVEAGWARAEVRRAIRSRDIALAARNWAMDELERERERNRDCAEARAKDHVPLLLGKGTPARGDWN